MSEQHEAPNTYDNERVKLAGELLGQMKQMTRDGFAIRTDIAERSIYQILLPEEQHNITAEALRQQAVQEYLFDASIKLRLALATRELKFPIRLVDNDLFPELQKNWEAKGFTCRKLSEGTANHFFVLLKW